MCLLCRTIFLNKSEKIRSNNVLSTLSWFLLPGSFICIVLGKAINEYVTIGSTWEIVYATLGNIPFIVGLIWGFWKFRRLQRCNLIDQLTGE
jgi:hypothetical protein